jgi:hypothetical protein
MSFIGMADKKGLVRKSGFDDAAIVKLPAPAYRQAQVGDCGARSGQVGRRFLLPDLFASLQNRRFHSTIKNRKKFCTPTEAIRDFCEETFLFCLSFEMRVFGNIQIIPVFTAIDTIWH